MSIPYKKGTIHFYKSNRKDKKYKAVYEVSGKPVKTTHFGAAGYQHFKDRTPLKLYSSLDHLDKERRNRYKKRHQSILLKDGTPAYKVPMSAAWLSMKYLW